jgi:hypothetical protein
MGLLWILLAFSVSAALHWPLVVTFVAMTFVVVVIGVAGTKLIDAISRRG